MPMKSARHTELRLDAHNSPLHPPQRTGEQPVIAGPAPYALVARRNFPGEAGTDTHSRISGN